MSRIMARYAKHSYAAMRIVTGFLLFCHGTQKLVGFPLPRPREAPLFVLYVAGPIETIGGLLLILGLFTRRTAFLCSGLMAAAYWIAHGLNHVLPMVNQGELAAVYCFVFLFISAHGPGAFSLDARRGRT